MYWRTVTIVAKKVVGTTISKLSYQLLPLFEQNFQQLH